MKVVLSLGRLHPLKGLDLLISAWAEIKRSAKVLKCESAKVEAEVTEDGKEAEDFRTLELPNFRTSLWQLVIAGPDEQGTREKLKGESEKLKLKWCEGETVEDGREADVVFLGPVHGEAKWELMRRADIFVLPSRSENFGMVVGEALSCGVPVVTTAVGPWGEGGGEVLKCGSAKVLKLGEGGGEVLKCGSAKVLKCEIKLETGNLKLGKEGEESGKLKVKSEKECGEQTPRQGEADPRAGLMVVETSVEGIAGGLRRMMALSDAERKEMGRNGAEWVRREFSWEAVAKKMVEAYENA